MPPSQRAQLEEPRWANMPASLAAARLGGGGVPSGRADLAPRARVRREALLARVAAAVREPRRRHAVGGARLHALASSLAYLPASHGTQRLRSVLLTWPGAARQSSHAVAPVAAAVPASHSRQLGWAAPACRPAAQISHFARSASGAKPSGHASQPPVREPAAATPLAGHGSHALASSLAYLPASHGMQRLRSVLLTWPGTVRQSSHVGRASCCRRARLALAAARLGGGGVPSGRADLALCALASGAKPSSHASQPPVREPAAATPSAGHGSHALASSLAYLPASHGTQRLRSVLLTWPGTARRTARRPWGDRAPPRGSSAGRRLRTFRPRRCTLRARRPARSHRGTCRSFPSVPGPRRRWRARDARRGVARGEPPRGAILRSAAAPATAGSSRRRIARTDRRMAKSCPARSARTASPSTECPPRRRCTSARRR